MPTRQAGSYSELELSASSAKTTSGDTTIYDGFGDSESLLILLEVTAVTGTTPTLDIALEHTFDGTTFYQIGKFAAANITAAGRYILEVSPSLTPATNVAVTALSGSTAYTRNAVSAHFANRIRVKWVIGGTTPSFTFRILALSQSPLS